MKKLYTRSPRNRTFKISLKYRRRSDTNERNSSSWLKAIAKTSPMIGDWQALLFLLKIFSSCEVFKEVGGKTRANFMFQYVSSRERGRERRASMYATSTGYHTLLSWSCVRVWMRGIDVIHGQCGCNKYGSSFCILFEYNETCSVMDTLKNKWSKTDIIWTLERIAEK